MVDRGCEVEGRDRLQSARALCERHHCRVLVTAAPARRSGQAVMPSVLRDRACKPNEGLME